jgi:hypothetical protein
MRMITAAHPEASTGRACAPRKAVTVGIAQKRGCHRRWCNELMNEWCSTRCGKITLFMSSPVNEQGEVIGARRGTTPRSAATWARSHRALPLSDGRDGLSMVAAPVTITGPLGGQAVEASLHPRRHAEYIRRVHTRRTRISWCVPRCGSIAASRRAARSRPCRGRNGIRSGPQRHAVHRAGAGRRRRDPQQRPGVGDPRWRDRPDASPEPSRSDGSSRGGTSTRPYLRTDFGQ